VKRIPLKSIPWLTVTTALFTLLLAGASLGGFAQYDRSAILRGEVWRLVTGHFSHWSLSHLGYDLFAFVILGAICERRDRRLFVTVSVAAALAVSLFLLAFCADVELYRGLSAIDSALWMLAVFDLGERYPRLAVVLASLFLAKVIVEARSGALFVDGITVLPVVHLIGAALGSIMATWRRPPTLSRTFSRPQRSANCARKSMPSPATCLSTASNAPPAPT
jgi:rhomboid family GlyGly-CTERM serine protease